MEKPAKYEVIVAAVTCVKTPRPLVSAVPIAVFQRADILLPASLSVQWYEKVAPLEMFVWRAAQPRISPPLFRMPFLT